MIVPSRGAGYYLTKKKSNSSSLKKKKRNQDLHLLHMAY